MTFGECHAAVGELVKSGDWRVLVRSWRDGKVVWEAWLADIARHVEAPGPQELVGMVRTAMAGAGLETKTVDAVQF